MWMGFIFAPHRATPSAPVPLCQRQPLPAMLLADTQAASASRSPGYKPSPWRLLLQPSPSRAGGRNEGKRCQVGRSWLRAPQAQLPGGAWHTSAQLQDLMSMGAVGQRNRVIMPCQEATPPALKTSGGLQPWKKAHFDSPLQPCLEKPDSRSRVGGHVSEGGTASAPC